MLCATWDGNVVSSDILRNGLLLLRVGVYNSIFTTNRNINTIKMCDNKCILRKKFYLFVFIYEILIINCAIINSKHQ